MSGDPDELDVHLQLVERDVEVDGCAVKVHCHCMTVDGNGRVRPKRLSTQRPSEISQTVLSQCGNWVSFRLASDRDLAAVQASSEWADRRDVKRISGLAWQNAVAFGESLRMPVSLIAPTASPTPKSSDAPFDKWAESGEQFGAKA